MQDRNTALSCQPSQVTKTFPSGSVQPVSYTHLDVYKRQDIDRQQAEPILRETLQVDDRTQISLFLIYPCSLANETGSELQKHTTELLDSFCMENYYVMPLPRQQGFLVMLTDTERCV